MQQRNILRYKTKYVHTYSDGETWCIEKVFPKWSGSEGKNHIKLDKTVLCMYTRMFSMVNALVNSQSVYISDWVNRKHWPLITTKKNCEVAESFLKSFHCPSYICMHTRSSRVHWLTTKWLLLLSLVIYFVDLLFVYYMYTPHERKKDTKKAKTIFRKNISGNLRIT